MSTALHTLLVEHDSAACLQRATELRRLGYQVSAYRSAGEAVAACRGDRFDVALLDSLLPGQQALDLCREIRSRSWGRRTVILLMTTDDRVELLEQALAAGVDDFLLVPFSVEQLTVRMKIAETRRHGRIAAEQANEALERRLQEMTALSRVGRLVTTSLSLDAVANAVLDGLTEAVRPDLTLLFLRENGSLLLHSFRAGVAELGDADGLAHSQGRKICEIAVRQDRPIYAADLKAGSWGAAPGQGETGLASFVALPLQLGPLSIGVLGLGSVTERDFKAQEQLLTTLANQVAIGLHNALLYERLHATLEALPDTLLEVDADGRTSSLHAPQTELLPCPPEQIVGRSLTEVLPEEAAKAVLRGLEEASATGRHVGETFSLDLEEGRRWFELSIASKGGERGHDARLVMLVRDITERRETEAGRVLLSTAIEQANDMVVITDANGSIMYVNPAFERTTGYLLERVLGKNPRILQSGKHSDRFYRELWQTLLDGRAWHGHLINRRADGTLYEEKAAIYPIRDETGTITNFVALKRDVTEEIVLQRRSHHARRMEALGEIAGGIAHDFNNLLTVIQGNIDLLRAPRTAPERVTEILCHMARATDSAAQLTRGMLGFSRQQVLTLQPRDLNEIISGVLPLLQRVLADDVAVELQPGEDLPAVNADKALIEQVLFNLCSNAAHALPDGGQILISTDQLVIDEQFLATHPWATAGRHVTLAVTDDGVGMDEETRLRALDPFFTTKGPGVGTGLGLSSVYGTIKQHNGIIELHSELGVGTTLTAYLPALDLPAVALPSSTAPAPWRQGGGESILVVEDLDGLREVLVALLESEGYKVEAAGDGYEALEALDRLPAIQLVIADVNMPRMGGGELYRRTRERAPKICFIFCSGNLRDWEQLGCADDTLVSYLEKPFDLDLLAKTVRSALDAGDDRGAALRPAESQ